MKLISFLDKYTKRISTIKNILCKVALYMYIYIYIYIYYLYFFSKIQNIFLFYRSPTSCLDPDVALNKLVLPGDRLGLSGKSPELLFPPNSPNEPVLCTTGKYPKRECFLKYFFDLNLFLSSFVKSRISSPEVV